MLIKLHLINGQQISPILVNTDYIEFAQDITHACVKEKSRIRTPNMDVEVLESINYVFEESNRGLINRAELFNRLAVIPAPPEANEYKAEVYKVINGM